MSGLTQLDIVLAAARLHIPLTDDFALLEPVMEYPRYASRARCPRGCGSTWWHAEGARQSAVDSLKVHVAFCRGRRA